MGKLDERDCKDEFQTENLFAGISIEDGSFYNNYFLPSCLFYIYQLWLKKADLGFEKMFNDLFTIGTGSATGDRRPFP